MSCISLAMTAENKSIVIANSTKIRDCERLLHLLKTKAKTTYAAT